MKKGLIIAFWCDYVVVVSVPLLFVLASKYDWAIFLDNASVLALFWVAASLAFLAFAITMGVNLKRNKAEIEHLNRNFKEIALILFLAIVGANLWVIKRKIPPEVLWNVVIVFWIVFTLFISRTLARFVRRYQQEMA